MIYVKNYFLNIIAPILVMVLLSLPLSSCSSTMPDWMDAEASKKRLEENKNKGKVQGKIQDTMRLFGGESDDDAGAKIGVNALLWRATLDTISFMPLDNADPFGGIITTEWYIDPSNQNERFKITVYILDTRLRADAVKVSIFRQIKENGEWINTSVNKNTAQKLENQILTSARIMRQSRVN